MSKKLSFRSEVFRVWRMSHHTNFISQTVIFGEMLYFEMRSKYKILEGFWDSLLMLDRWLYFQIKARFLMSDKCWPGLRKNKRCFRITSEV